MVVVLGSEARHCDGFRTEAVFVEHECAPTDDVYKLYISFKKFRAGTADWTRGHETAEESGTKTENVSFYLFFLI